MPTGTRLRLRAKLRSQQRECHKKREQKPHPDIRPQE
jgi:hypothetical protein